MYTTNYYNTLIEIAEDCKTDQGLIPPMKGDKLTVANIQYQLLSDNPYKYTSDEVLFGTYARRKGFCADDMEEQRVLYFSKGQACFRASPLTKSYGWGVHSNAEGRIALLAMESEAYKAMQSKVEIKKVKAMRNKRK